MDWEGQSQEHFRLLAFLVEHLLDLEGEGHQEERRRAFNHLQDLVVRLVVLLLGFSHRRGFKGRLVREGGFHHQGLEGGDHRIHLQEKIHKANRCTFIKMDLRGED